MANWIVIIPPLLVISCVLFTRRMVLSFLLGIASSALIATNGNPIQALTLSLTRLSESAGIPGLTGISAFLSNASLLIFSFLLLLGILIELLAATGADQAYVTITKRHVKSKKAAQSASLVLSLFFFFDDYFSALTVGSVMRPLAFLHKVHPVKLAFLTTAMASPLVILSPISSWVGQISLQLKLGGIAPSQAAIIGDPYFAYINSIPFIFYALALIVSTWYIVLRGISFGPMKTYDAMAYQKPASSEAIPRDTSFFDFLLPLILLVGGVFLMFLYTGGYFSGGTSFAHAIKNASPNLAFFAGGLTSVIISALYFLLKRTISLKMLIECIVKGFQLMYPSIIMLICVWALGSMLTNDLKTGSYIATMVSQLISIGMFPVMCFLFAAFIASMIGSAWATMGLMFPIVIEMLQRLLEIAPNTPLDAVPLLIPIIGATLSGCVMGTHLSLISDNPILSSASTGANHLEHVKTMAWYVVPVGISTAIAYVFIGMTASSWGLMHSMSVGLIVGIALSILLLEIGQWLFSRS
jgi:tetracycline resistance efflux pump